MYIQRCPCAVVCPFMQAQQNRTQTVLHSTTSTQGTLNMSPTHSHCMALTSFTGSVEFGHSIANSIHVKQLSTVAV